MKKTLALAAIAIQIAFAQTTGLKDVYSGYFKVGSVLNGTTVNNAAIKQIMIKDFNSITMENEMKPDATLVQSNSTDTDIKVQLNSSAKAILDFCKANNIKVRGHTLVWHSQTPQWFFKKNFQNNGDWVDKATMKKRLESYIKNMFALIKDQGYQDVLYAYDVVNEAVSDDSNRTKNNGGAREAGYNDGKSPWVQVYGDNSFIEDAFTFARQYAPSNIKLFYNDYNEFWDHKRDCILKTIVEPLFKKGVLDGVGMQSHMSANPNASFGDATAYITAMDMYSNTGAEVQMTEIDVSTEKGKWSLDKDQPKRYKALFKNALDINKGTKGKGKVTAMCVWGPNDANSWVGSTDGVSNAPLLYDANNNKKPAYDTLFALGPNSVSSSPSSSSVAPSSSSNPSSSSSAAQPPKCSLSDSNYVSGSSIPRPTVSCAGGASASSAKFNITGANDGGTPNSDLNWNNTPPENHSFWNVGSGRVVRLYQVSCGSNVLNYGEASQKNGITCGTINIMEPAEPTCNEYESSFCGDMAWADVLGGSTTMPKKGECLYIGDFSKIQPWLKSTVVINGLANTCKDDWGEDNGNCPFNTKPDKKDGGYYVYVKEDVEGDGINWFENNGWQGIVARPKPTCAGPTPILNSPIQINNSRITYYSIKGEPLGSVKPQKAGIYIVKQGSSVKKIVVR